jgi:hypothetical protein
LQETTNVPLLLQSSIRCGEGTKKKRKNRGIFSENLDWKIKALKA